MQPERILVRGLNWLGDAVMSTPALLRLREARPDATIVLLTPEKLAELWDHHPALSAVLTFSETESVFQVAHRLRSERFAKALLLPNSPRSALEAFLARIPERIGYARSWRTPFLTRPVPPRPGEFPMRKLSVREIRRLVRPPGDAPAWSIPAAAHHIHQYLHLAATLGANPDPVAPRVTVTPEEMEQTQRRFDLTPIAGQGGPWFGMNPGAHYGPAKRWPVERFIEAALELTRRTGCRWLIFGSEADAPWAAQIESALNVAGGRGAPGTLASPAGVVNLAGRTRLRELCALLRSCSVLLTNDSGPMHLAAAVGTPVVVPFGSTSPELTGPGWPGEAGSRHALVRVEAPCAPCFRRVCPIDFRCMRGIAVSEVVEATLRASGLGDGSSPRNP